MLKNKADTVVACLVLVCLIVFLFVRTKMIEKENTADRTDSVIVNSR